MYNSFIPNFHFRPSSEKMTAAWFDEVNKYCWYNAGNRNLLEGKDLIEIQGYATGNYSMTPFKKMFKSVKKQFDDYNSNNINFNRLNTQMIIPVDGFVQTPLIPVKLNAAISLVDKIPIDLTVNATDSFAAKKKQEDITFLKNKPALEADLQDLADQMQIGKVDLGTTKHSAIPFSDSPYGLDLNEPDELQVFVDILYNLAVEAALETAVEQMAEIKNVAQIKTLEIKDHFWYGASAHFAFESAITNLPDIEYIFPGDIILPYSNLPDFNDNQHRFLCKRITALELLNYFGNEICDESALDNILNEKQFGYCACNSRATVSQNDFGSCKIELVYCMFKSVDFVGVAPLNKKSKFNYVVTDPEEAGKCTNKVWGQNTYCGWWLKNTKYYFGIHKLGFAHRTIGQESYQNFPLNINKSQEKSAVELCIGENKKAQIADIKMQHAILKSQPRGKYVDLKYIRSALLGLVDEGNKWTQQDLINLFMEQNYMIGDTEGFEGKNEGQFKPFQDIPGGVNIAEIDGYLRIIADANSKTSLYTGINENIIGQKAEQLVGNQKLLISAGINALDYVTKAIQNQYQKLYSNWGNRVKDSVEKGGKAKEAIVNLVGSKKVSLIDALDDLPLHTMGIKVSINQNEEAKENFKKELNKNEINGVIDTVDIYMLESITNPKDRIALLAVRIKQWKKREAKKRAEDMANQQAMIKAQGENMLAAAREKTASEIEKIYKQGEVSAHILQLAAQLGIQDKQLDFIGKKALQQDRGADQTNKAVQTLETKSQLENQKALE